MPLNSYRGRNIRVQNTFLLLTLVYAERNITYQVV